MKQTSDFPQARTDGMVVREMADELLVYDTARDRAHCLNRTAALTWQHCDGQTNTREIALKLSRELSTTVSEEIVLFALAQLQKEGLLVEPEQMPAAIWSRMSRREMVRTLGVAAAVAVPVVSSILAPNAAQAATCLPTGSACTTGAQCCSTVCTGGLCT
jgi:hypothetical protein